jgi:hypothetical protein
MKELEQQLALQRQALGGRRNVSGESRSGSNQWDGGTVASEGIRSDSDQWNGGTVDAGWALDPRMSQSQKQTEKHDEQGLTEEEDNDALRLIEDVVGEDIDWEDEGEDGWHAMVAQSEERDKGDSKAEVGGHAMGKQSEKTDKEDTREEAAPAQQNKRARGGRFAAMKDEAAVERDWNGGNGPRSSNLQRSNNDDNSDESSLSLDNASTTGFPLDSGRQLHASKPISIEGEGKAEEDTDKGDDRDAGLDEHTNVNTVTGIDSCIGTDEGGLAQGGDEDRRSDEEVEKSRRAAESEALAAEWEMVATEAREEDDFYQRVAFAQNEADRLEARARTDAADASAKSSAAVRADIETLRAAHAEESRARAGRAAAMEAQATSRRARAERAEAKYRADAEIAEQAAHAEKSLALGGGNSEGDGTHEHGRKTAMDAAWALDPRMDVSTFTEESLDSTPTVSKAIEDTTDPNASEASKASEASEASKASKAFELSEDTVDSNEDLRNAVKSEQQNMEATLLVSGKGDGTEGSSRNKGGRRGGGRFAGMMDEDAVESDWRHRRTGGAPRTSPSSTEAADAATAADDVGGYSESDGGVSLDGGSGDGLSLDSGRQLGAAAPMSGVALAGADPAFGYGDEEGLKTEIGDAIPYAGKQVNTTKRRRNERFAAMKDEGAVERDWNGGNGPRSSNLQRSNNDDNGDEGGLSLDNASAAGFSLDSGRQLHASQSISDEGADEASAAAVEEGEAPEVSGILEPKVFAAGERSQSDVPAEEVRGYTMSNQSQSNDPAEEVRGYTMSNQSDENDRLTETENITAEDAHIFGAGASSEPQADDERGVEDETAPQMSLEEGHIELLTPRLNGRKVSEFDNAAPNLPAATVPRAAASLALDDDFDARLALAKAEAEEFSLDDSLEENEDEHGDMDGEGEEGDPLGFDDRVARALAAADYASEISSRSNQRPLMPGEIELMTPRHVAPPAIAADIAASSPYADRSRDRTGIASGWKWNGREGEQGDCGEARADVDYLDDPTYSISEQTPPIPPNEESPTALIINERPSPSPSPDDSLPSSPSPNQISPPASLSNETSLSSLQSQEDADLWAERTRKAMAPPRRPSFMSGSGASINSRLDVPPPVPPQFRPEHQQSAAVALEVAAEATQNVAAITAANVASEADADAATVAVLRADDASSAAAVPGADADTAATAAALDPDDNTNREDESGGGDGGDGTAAAHWLGSVLSEAAPTDAIQSEATTAAAAASEADAAEAASAAAATAVAAAAAVTALAAAKRDLVRAKEEKARVSEEVATAAKHAAKDEQVQGLGFRV